MIDLFLNAIVPAMGILVAVIVLAWILHVLLARLGRVLTRLAGNQIEKRILSSLERRVIALIALIGLYVLALYVPLEGPVRFYISKGFYILVVVVGAYVVVGSIDTLAHWYSNQVSRKGGLAVQLIWLLRLVVLLVGALAATLLVLGAIGVNMAPVSGWLSGHGWRIGLILAASTAALIAVARVVPAIVQRAVARPVSGPLEEVSKRMSTLSRVLVNFSQIVVLLITAFTILAELEINIAPIIAGVGVVGIAVGFGAQSLVKDLLAGLFVIMENQYQVGDVVRIADVAGLVEDINLRRTVLRDLDGIVHVIPNGEIRVSSNFTKEWSRVNINVSVDYKEDLNKVIAVINRVGQQLAEDPAWAPFILKPPQVLRVDNLTTTAVEIKILGDTKPIQQWSVMGELRLRLKAAFDSENIEFAWPRTKINPGGAAALTKAGGPTQE
ncbi:MAG: mechanosensitive ion channel family protein [Chloroflexi bacterium]|nr:mechanosensitive ion channel family protein [Chloroflexota bacterium]